MTSEFNFTKDIISDALTNSTSLNSIKTNTDSITDALISISDTEDDIKNNTDKLQSLNGAVIDLSSTDYVNAGATNGFTIFVPPSSTGAIKVDTVGGQTLTITDYIAGQALRGSVGARFAKVYKTGTVATNLEAWY